ncbi:MAG: hypothetical protein KatS3mg109_0230 [Pirellulaceae bacterium]|nr:MAG: hypothetical protein KatS3mg109_0230 [Pirellulaceae bacterium]
MCWSLPALSRLVLKYRYLHGPVVDQVFAREDVESLWQPGEVLWALGDHLGTVRDLIDSAGNVVNHLRYEAFGRITSETNAAVDFLFAFTGRERDEESALFYYRARYYDPAVGRFISEDPLGFGAGDANLATYVSNHPVAYVDPTGQTENIPVRGRGFIRIDAEEMGTRNPHIHVWGKDIPQSKIQIPEHVQNVDDLLKIDLPKGVKGAIKYVLDHPTYRKVLENQLKNAIQKAKTFGKRGGMVVAIVITIPEIANAAMENGMAGAFSEGCEEAAGFVTCVGAGMVANLALGKAAMAGGVAGTGGTGALVVGAAVGGYYVGDKFAHVTIAGKTVPEYIGEPIGVGAWYIGTGVAHLAHRISDAISSALDSIRW